MGPFRVIATGVGHFRDYARLRHALDRLLQNRLPDVVILSRCGRGTNALATGYVVERGLNLIPKPTGSALLAECICCDQTGAGDTRAQDVDPAPGG
jgi:hypothetical protein